MPIRVHWDSSFSVGNVVLDRQHQKLLDLCNELAECIATDQQERRRRFHEVLYQLSQYARDHFKFEESLLLKFQYSGLDAQQVEHNAYVETVTEWSFAAAINSIDMLEVQHFLAVWWRDHILISDMQYKTLMQSKR